MQFRPLRLQFDRPAQFADGAIEVSGKIPDPPERAMRLGIVWSKPRCLGSAEKKKQRRSELNKAHSTMKEIRFHATETRRVFSKILTCLLPRPSTSCMAELAPQDEPTPDLAMISD